MGEPSADRNITGRKVPCYFSLEDCTVYGWNIDKGKVTPDNFRFNNRNFCLYERVKMCVSDDKKFAFSYHYTQPPPRNYQSIGIVNMNNTKETIKLDLDYKFKHLYCTFDLKKEFIVIGYVLSSRERHNIMVRIYSTQSNNNEWTCKRMYEIPEDFIFVGISKYSKLYLRSSNNSIHEWNLLTGRSTSMFSYEEMIESPKHFKDIIISSNEKFVCLKINDNIIIYSVELEIPVITLQAKEIEEVQVETKEDLEQHQTQEETQG
ncbi:uncharacterized protein OCT59_016405 [Rhizophagus irregularis]|nr:hypothetical protein OCT59_016405 [Rhizophagus irregularis]